MDDLNIYSIPCVRCRTRRKRASISNKTRCDAAFYVTIAAMQRKPLTDETCCGLKYGFGTSTRRLGVRYVGTGANLWCHIRLSIDKASGVETGISPTETFALTAPSDDGRFVRCPEAPVSPRSSSRASPGAWRREPRVHTQPGHMAIWTATTHSVRPVVFGSSNAAMTTRP
jgi:hypothetical protein